MWKCNNAFLSNVEYSWATPTFQNHILLLIRTHRATPLFSFVHICIFVHITHLNVHVEPHPKVDCWCRSITFAVFQEYYCRDTRSTGILLQEYAKANASVPIASIKPLQSKLMGNRTHRSINISNNSYHVQYALNTSSTCLKPGSAKQVNSHDLVSTLIGIPSNAAVLFIGFSN